MLFIDDHTKFCVLRVADYHGQSNRWEWRAHRKDGEVCRPEDGGVLEPCKPRPKAKNPARADGIFGVCATIPRGGRRRVGRRMKPLRYKGKVVGIAHHARRLEQEVERVRQLGLKNRANVADPNNKTARPGVWYNHVGPGVNPY